MKNISIIDTVSEYGKIKKEIDTAVARVLESGVYINGPEVKKIELEISRFLHVKYCVSCANGTDALKIALLALDLKPGDEVLVPTFTFVSTAEVVVLLGYKPVFIDVDFRTFLIDVNSIKKHITSKTKAIIPVHLFGQSVNMIEIMKVSQRYNLSVIEDSAQSFGAPFLKKDFNKNTYSFSQYTGTIGHIGTTSFYPTKNLSCFGDGGALFTNNSRLAKKIRLISNHGQQKKYTYTSIGLNSRLDAIQASILRVKLKYLTKMNNLRRDNAKFYNARLNKIDKIFLPKCETHINGHIFHQYTLIIQNKKLRDNLMSFLSKKGIATMIYYPRPLHKEKPYKLFASKHLKNSEKLSNRVISLPIHPEISKEDIKYICDNVIKFFHG